MPEFTFIPAHTHDCTECTYLGTGNYLGNTVDVYLACKHSMYKYIVRFGNDGDYITVFEHGTFWELCEKMANDPALKKHRLMDKMCALRTERANLMERVYELTVEIDAVRLKMLRS